MQINNHQIVDYDAVLDAKFGAEGTPERAEAEEKAYAFYGSPRRPSLPPQKQQGSRG